MQLFTPTIGGLAISQTEEETKKGRSFTCPNAACGKIFTTPLKALNLQLSPGKVYDACPYCLTELSAEGETPMVPSRDKSSSCARYLGYLCERSTSDNVPDECILCKDLIPCMLKNMKQ